MQLYSTKHQSPNVGFEEAIFRGLPPDNGLYMPTVIPTLDDAFFKNIDKLSFQEIAHEVAKKLIGDDIEASALKNLVYEAVNFPAPLVEIEENVSVLELFHGPSLAFKDFGARFMSRVMSYFLQKTSKEIHILVATSGDTGGAVALGFLNTPGIKVTILYPSGKVSELQEKQLTTLGANITALEVKGTFDDCQKMVKEAFLDKDLTSKFNLASANSINIARLIPQSFYYFNTYAQLKPKGLPVVFAVPSGNFGNIGAGLIAKRMGLPVHKFVAATNANDIIPEYLWNGEFLPRPSIRTLSNAMDVGNPSNFQRIEDLYGKDVQKLREDVVGVAFSDDQTERAIDEIYKKTNYIACPHTAVAYLGLKSYLATEPSKKLSGVFLSTAHPSKFTNEMKAEIASKVEIPEQLAELMPRAKKSIVTENTYDALKKYLLS